MTGQQTKTDILVIGGGIAGASAAYEMAAFASVILLERETHCGYHSTGRSAASFTENYGNDLIRRLAIASRPFLSNPPPGFCDSPLLMPRGMITIARSDQLDMLKAELERAIRLVPSIRPMDPNDAIERVPVLRKNYVKGAIFEPNSMEVDVHGLHQGFLRGARERKARIVTGAEVTSVERQDGSRLWSIQSTQGEFAAPIIINAAGAWADDFARMAGVMPVGLVPKRRTAFNIPVPDGVNIKGWPLVNDVGDEFYFKPDAGQIFVSPSDATPSPPMDAYPEDLDVAIGAERLEAATSITVRRVSHSWAGLRTFATDGSPVVGRDDTIEGFYWLAGQGGYGIKTSPALARSCASLVRGTGLPDDLIALGVDESDLSPARLRNSLHHEEGQIA